MTKRHPLSALLAVSVALACVCPALAQERAQAPQSLNGASIRIKTAEEKEILCKAKDLHIILYEPQGSSARLIFTHAEEVNGTFQKIRYKKLSEMKPTTRKNTRELRPSLLLTPSKAPFTMFPWKAASGPAALPTRLNPYRAWKSFSPRTYPFMGMKNASKSFPRRKNSKNRNSPEPISNSE